MNSQHANKDVQAAIVRLNDALCMYERDTGIQVAVIIRDERGFVHRSLNGKPSIPPDVSDEDLIVQASPEGGPK